MQETGYTFLVFARKYFMCIINNNFKHNLTFRCIAGTIVHVLPKFRFWNKKGSLKIKIFECRVYESVDDRSLS